MPSFVIRTDLPPDQAIKDILAVIKDASSPAADPELWRLFRQDLFEHIQLGFGDKSVGMSDSLGNRWKPLHPLRVKAKRRALSKQPLHRDSQGRITGIVAKGYRSISGDLERRMSKYILYDTGRLQEGVRAFSRPSLNPDAKVHLSQNSITCELLIPYAEFQSTDQKYFYHGRMVFKPGRPIWPDTLGFWFDDAVDKLTKRIASAIGLAVSDVLLFFVPQKTN